MKWVIEIISFLVSLIMEKLENLFKTIENKQQTEDIDSCDEEIANFFATKNNPDIPILNKRPCLDLKKMRNNSLDLKSIKKKRKTKPKYFSLIVSKCSKKSKINKIFLQRNFLDKLLILTEYHHIPYKLKLSVLLVDLVAVALKTKSRHYSHI
ncbi:hypothetical protein BpHYR1_047331 [Brachionus plicatilis]|uniref:Uncharacterized protein n=1 Tax=Brachionus plicatilis TaxID=10195 RepID=A0A3M7S442_BRAPC|nr:hypothetical protein BpHYR1_047331 [Brachionus plicatilis]